MSDRDDLLISADALKHRLSDTGAERPILLDTRFNLADTDEGERHYREGHIPGAFYAHLDRDLSGSIVPGETGRHPLPEPAQLQATLRARGIRADSEVIVYDAANAMIAGRAWWLCRWAGLDRVRVLDGGWQAWLDAGGPVESGSGPEPADGDIEVRCPTEWIVDADQLLRNTGRYTLLDARARPRYSGETEPMDHKAGHIPGALCADFTANLDDSGRFKSAPALRQRFESVPDDGNLVCYCGSGVTACHNILALTLAGHRQPRLYAGSWSEWINDDSRPVATGTEKEPV
ncbi:sulfurtransferase [Saccharospirillum salsuginis]|uniref:3-mercaptopyruvate sulfurtransferase n=1 Tax=Saccharospirillum salsuginis TaxID=418750 RepID=A0A918JZ99_9GAMM|nr:sulfurtransferase [Saccharospirillum salsuginis]GGX38283.1 putative 3-mercaptopyruvate sulfurtransferase [Saccharospirillum salsuginis]